MKISLIQFAPALLDLATTITRLRPLLEQCRGSDIVCLPELCNSGYYMTSLEEASSHSINLSDVSDPFLSFLKDMAISLHLGIVVGVCEIEDKNLFNTALFIRDDGLIACKYRKLHLFLNEKNIFTPGDVGLPTTTFRGCTFGLQICFDWAFPEPWRHLALHDCHVIFHPANLVLPFCQQVLPSYSLISRVYICTCNRIGQEGDLKFLGHSQISAPDGSVVALLDHDKEDIVTLEIDLSKADSKMITPKNHLFHDRRCDVYPDLSHLLKEVFVKKRIEIFGTFSNICPIWIGCCQEGQQDIITLEIYLSKAYTKMITPKNHLFYDRRSNMYPDLAHVLKEGL